MWMFVFSLILLIYCLSFCFWYLLERFLKKRNLLNNTLENMFYLFKYNSINAFYFITTTYYTLLHLEVGEKNYLELIILYILLYILVPLLINLIILRYLNDKCRFNLISLLIMLSVILITKENVYVLLFTYFCITILNIVRIRAKGLKYFTINTMQNFLTALGMLTIYGLFITSLIAIVIKYWYLFK